MYSLNFIRQRIATTICDAHILLKWPQCQRFLCSKPSDIAMLQTQFVEKQRGLNRLRHAEAGIDWDAEIQAVYGDDEAKRNRSVLTPVIDEMEIYAAPVLKPTYHLAAYVNKSPTLQKLLKMGVVLHMFDRNIKLATFIASLDFDRHIKEHIIFLTEIGLSQADVSRILTHNPKILQESLDDLRARVNYLLSKRFTPENVTDIIKHNLHWLNRSTTEIDTRLGYFQKLFRLNGDEVRAVAVTGPKVITEEEKQIIDITFAVKEECCFEAAEAKAILLKCPSVWLQPRFNLMMNYDYVNRTMEIDNEQLAVSPFILLARNFRIKERHGFLREIRRAQFNPQKPLYIPLDILCKGTDEEFAANIAKRPLQEFNNYLRTL